LWGGVGGEGDIDEWFHFLPECLGPHLTTTWRDTGAVWCGSKTGQVHRKHLAVCHIIAISTYRQVRKVRLPLVPNNQTNYMELSTTREATRC
jgi:hypothetical protein